MKSPLFITLEILTHIPAIPVVQVQHLFFSSSSVSLSTYMPLHHKTYLRTCAPSEDSDQPVHSRSLIRIFTGHILDREGCKVSSCRQRRLWSDCADAQADLSFRWAHISEVPLSHVVAHINIINIQQLLFLCRFTTRIEYCTQQLRIRGKKCPHVNS